MKDKQRGVDPEEPELTRGLGYNGRKRREHQLTFTIRLSIAAKVSYGIRYGGFVVIPVLSQ